MATRLRYGRPVLEREGAALYGELFRAGSQRIEPYEQKTQQSPGFGRSVMPHAGHVQKNRHASAGIRSSTRARHSGQVRVARVLESGKGYSLKTGFAPAAARSG
jgi:hypothetical protein